MKLRDRASFDKRREHLHRQAEIRRDARHVGLGAGDVQEQRAAGMDRLAGRRHDANAHARGDDECVLAVFLQGELHAVIPFK